MSWSALSSYLFSFLLQAQLVPTEGSPLREVARLERVPEPPGGLIPYRKGKLWGYADTTGRLIIQPVWQGHGVQETVLFRDGFAIVAPPVPLAAVKWLPGRTAALSQGAEYRLYVINARGELLRVRKSESAVRQSDGSLRVLPRWQAHGRWELRTLYQFPEEATGVSHVEYQRVQQADDQPENLPVDAYDVRLLGARRASWSVKPPRQVRSHASARQTSLNRYTLAKLDGRCLTDYRFASLHPFSENRAAFGLRDTPAAGSKALTRYGFLDTTGREVIAAHFTRVSAFRGGRAVVQTNGQFGIINAKGQYVLSPNTQDLSDPDELGFIRQELPIAGQPDEATKCYLPPPGQKGFANLLFDGAGPFRHGRAWVQQGQRVGLINEAGHYVTPVSYERLFTPLRIRSKPGEVEEFDLYAERAWGATYALPNLPGNELPRADPTPSHIRPDTAYLIARRQGKYGVVLRRTGREVVPAIYDSVIANARRGILGMRRAQQDYVVVGATGSAIKAHYNGVDFLTQRERLLYVVREQPAAWALLDTLGQLKTPWVPGTGYPTAGGWLLTSDASGWTLRDSTGHVRYTSPVRIEQPVADAYWAAVQRSLNESEQDLEHSPYWLLPLRRLPAEAKGCFYIRESSRLRILDARLRELTPIAFPTSTSVPVRTEILRSGWVYQVPASFQAVFVEGWFPPTRLALYTDSGQLLKLPSSMLWAYIPIFDYVKAWGMHGVLPTTQGYLTRGGRQLWTE